MKKKLVTMPLALFNKLVKSAKGNRRSVMSEIVFRLEKSFE